MKILFTALNGFTLGVNCITAEYFRKIRKY